MVVRRGSEAEQLFNARLALWAYMGVLGEPESHFVQCA